jgi:hypothetical protein
VNPERQQALVKLGILSEIQSQLVDGNTPIGPILMKARLLAAKLGSDDLEEWVKHEAEGYPQGIDVPDYRNLGMSISGSFDFGFGKRLNNAPIPSIIVQQVAGEEWSQLKLRDSAASIDAIVSSGVGMQLDRKRWGGRPFYGIDVPKWCCDHIKRRRPWKSVTSLV